MRLGLQNNLIGGSPVWGPSSKKGMIAWLKLDEGSGTSAADASGNGKTGTLEGSPTWSLGYLQGALTFDDTNRDVMFAGTDGITSTGATWTVAFWIKPTTPTRDYGGIFGRNTTDTGIYLRSTRKIDLYYGGTHLSTNALTDNAWSHVAIVCDAGAVTQYLNGVANGTSSSCPALSGKYIGTDQYSNFLKAQLDDFRFYDIALTAGQVATLAAVPTLQFAPNAPTSMVLAPQDATTMRVSWTASATDSTHAAATAYSLYKSSDNVNFTLVSASATSGIDVTGLTNGITWYFKVYGSNTGGLSATALSGNGLMTAPVPQNLTAPTLAKDSGAGSGDQVMDTLSISVGTWSNSPTSYAYRWFRNGTPITGETSLYYVLRPADVGKTITAGVIATNAGGPSSEATAAALITPIISYQTAWVDSGFGGTPALNDPTKGYANFQDAHDALVSFYGYAGKVLSIGLITDDAGGYGLGNDLGSYGSLMISSNTATVRSLGGLNLGGTSGTGGTLYLRDVSLSEIIRTNASGTVNAVDGGAIKGVNSIIATLNVDGTAGADATGGSDASADDQSANVASAGADGPSPTAGGTGVAATASGTSATGTPTIGTGSLVMSFSAGLTIGTVNGRGGHGGNGASGGAGAYAKGGTGGKGGTNTTSPNGTDNFGGQGGDGGSATAHGGDAVGGANGGNGGVFTRNGATVTTWNLTAGAGGSAGTGGAAGTAVGGDYGLAGAGYDQNDVLQDPFGNNGATGSAAANAGASAAGGSAGSAGSHD